MTPRRCRTLAVIAAVSVWAGAVRLGGAGDPAIGELPEVVVRGAGAPTMVLIPCMSCRWTAWERFMARNVDRWTMYAVTLPGFGGTAVPDLPRDGDAPVWQDNAVAAVTRLLTDRDLHDVVLVGHSFGAVIALQVAARLPDRVSHVVNVDGGIVSSRTWFPDDLSARGPAATRLTATNTQQYADAEAWRRFNVPALGDPRRAIDYHGMFMATPRQVVFQYWRENLLRDLNPLLASLRQPLLDVKAIAASDPDPNATRAGHLDALREAGAPPSVQTAFLYNTGHFVHEDRPGWLEDAIVAFLTGNAVANGTPKPASGVALPGRFGEVRQVGTGPTPLILMPCLGCDWRAFDELMTWLSTTYRMYAVTWPGMGSTPLPRSAGSTGTPLIDNVVDALARLVRDEHLDRPVLVAHSAAGPVAVRFAVEHPELVGAVVTVDATIQNDTTLGFSTADRSAWAEKEMAQVLRKYDEDAAWRRMNTPQPRSVRTPARLRMYERMWMTPPRAHVLAYWREWLALDAGTLLPRLSVPTLAMFAIPRDAPDRSTRRAALEAQFRRNRASASVSLAFVEPATHSIWETRPEEFTRLLQRFVDANRR